MTSHIEHALRQRVSRILFVFAVGMWFALGSYLYRAQERYSEEAAADHTFRAVFESSEAALLLADADAHIVDWNRAAERLLGWSEEEIRGRRLDFLFRLGSSGREQDFWREHLLREDLGNRTIQLDCPVRRKDGSTLPAVVEIWRAELDEPLPQGHGEIFFALKISRRDRVLRMTLPERTVQKGSPR